MAWTSLMLRYFTATQASSLPISKFAIASNISISSVECGSFHLQTIVHLVEWLSPTFTQRTLRHAE